MWGVCCVSISCTQVTWCLFLPIVLCSSSDWQLVTVSIPRKQWKQCLSSLKNSTGHLSASDISDISSIACIWQQTQRILLFSTLSPPRRSSTSPLFLWNGLFNVLVPQRFQWNQHSTVFCLHRHQNLLLPQLSHFQIKMARFQQHDKEFRIMYSWGSLSHWRYL